jgi:hypothetical protein
LNLQSGLFAISYLRFSLSLSDWESEWLGYHCLGKLNWVDSLLNASMILGGMGPVDTLHSTAAKIFASCYALFSGLVFIGVASLIVVPFAHRLLHRFHLDQK